MTRAKVIILPYKNLRVHFSPIDQLRPVSVAGRGSGFHVDFGAGQQTPVVGARRATVRNVRSNRRNTTALITAAAAVTSLLAGAQLAHATSYTWDGGDAPTATWSDIVNWVGDTAAPSAAA